MLPAAIGTYLLLLEATAEISIEVGRRGHLDLRPGWYGYVGSAFGPGGLAARVGRHLRGSDRPRWHIDYLRRATLPRGVWYAPGPERLEHPWARKLCRAPRLALPLAGFGASDCSCPSHLFRLAAPPGEALLRYLQAAAPSRPIARLAAASGDAL